MKLKQMLLWQWDSNRMAFLIFFAIVIAATVIVTMISAALFPPDYHASILASLREKGIIDASTPSDMITISTENLKYNINSIIPSAVFLFIIGLASFSENLRVALSNGVSRRTHFKSFAAFALAAALVSSTLCLLIDLIPRLSPITYATLFTQNPFELFVFFFLVSLFVLTLGYFITGGYYRMGTLSRVFVSVFVPLGIIFFLSIVDNVTVLGMPNPIVQPWNHFMEWMSHLWNASAFLIVCAALFLLLGWLLTRRAPVGRQQNG